MQSKKVFFCSVKQIRNFWHRKVQELYYVRTYVPAYSFNSRFSSVSFLLQFARNLFPLHSSSSLFLIPLLAQNLGNKNEIVFMGFFSDFFYDIVAGRLSSSANWAPWKISIFINFVPKLGRFVYQRTNICSSSVFIKSVFSPEVFIALFCSTKHVRPVFW